MPSGLKVVVDTLNLCLEEVMGWMRAMKRKLSPDKSEFLLVESNSVLGSVVVD